MSARPQSAGRAVVIGAGFGGLAAALRLRARGHRVLVVERQDQPGGRATVYRRGGFVFDAGPTIITAPFLLEELFELFGERLSDHLELRELDLWYRLRFADGRSFDYSSSLQETLAEVERFEPADVDGYRRLLADTEEIYRIGFERLGDQPFHDPRVMLRLLPSLLRLRSDRSVYGRTARYIRDHHLRQAFSFHPLLVGGNPFTTTSIYSLIHYLERTGGVHFAMGGTAAIVDALVDLMRRQGVEIEFGATVEEIEVSGGRARGVRLADGRREAADLVVANADAATVYKRLLPGRRRRWSDRKIERQRYSMGLFVLYFGSRRTYPHLAHHEILLGPRYRGLIADIFEAGKLTDDFSLYLHAPTRTDPSLAPPGCESMYALVPVPNLRAGIDWSEAGPRLRDRVVAHLDATVCPGLAEDITEDFFVTPEHFRDRLLSHHGAGFSIQPLLTQSAWFRFHNRSEEVAGLYLVGAGTHPGAGLPGVLTSAKVLDRVLDEEAAELPRRRPRRRPGGRSGEEESATALLARRSHTFRWASRLLPRPLRRDIAELYRFCRTVDDAADLGDDAAGARFRLDEWERILRGSRSGHGAGDAVTDPLLALAHRHGMSLTPALELIAGMRSDLQGVALESGDELLSYAYRAAGTVGLMFAWIAGAREPSARRSAIDLGIAMQLTNIARDVAEDLATDRIYLPAAWIDHAVLRRAVEQGDPEASARLQETVERLLDLADDHYRSGRRGIHHLPVAARWGVLTAARAYRAIGVEIRRRGAGYWQRRVAVTTRTQLGASLGSALSLLFERRPPRAPLPAAGSEPRRPAA